MASKSSAVHSVRVQNDLWEWLTAEAKRRGVTPNGLVCDLLLVGRLRADEARLAPKAEEPKRVAKAKPAAASPKAAPFQSRLKGEWKAP